MKNNTNHVTRIIGPNPRIPDTLSKEQAEMIYKLLAKGVRILIDSRGKKSRKRRR